jgi:acyl carrier protein
MSIAAAVEGAVREHVQSYVINTVVSLGADPARIAVDRPLTELGMDAIDILELTQILEYEYDVKLFAVAAKRLHTIADAVHLVVSRLA